MLLHLRFIHVFDFFYNEIGDSRPPIFRLVIVIDIYIVIIDDLDDFWRIGFAQSKLPKTHSFQLLLDIEVSLRTIMAIFTIRDVPGVRLATINGCWLGFLVEVRLVVFHIDVLLFHFYN